MKLCTAVSRNYIVRNIEMAKRNPAFSAQQIADMEEGLRNHDIIMNMLLRQREHQAKVTEVTEVTEVTRENKAKS